MRLTALFASVALLGGVTGIAHAQDKTATAPAPPPPPTEERREVNVQVHIAPDGRRVLALRPGATDAPREKGAFLGVATSPPTAVVREQLKLSPGMGLVVDVVEKDSPAEQAGLKRYDVLTKLGDQRLINAEQLAVLVRSQKPGDEIELTVIRGGAATTLKAKLAERELAPLDDILFFHGRLPGRELEGEWLHQLLPDVPGGPPGQKRALTLPVPRPDRGGVPGARSVTTWTDGEHVLTITTEPGHPGRKLVAKDKHGAVLYDGDLDAPGARDKLPTIVKEKLSRMEGAGVKPPKPGADYRDGSNSDERDGKLPPDADGKEL